MLLSLHPNILVHCEGEESKLTTFLCVCALIFMVLPPFAKGYSAKCFVHKAAGYIHCFHATPKESFSTKCYQFVKVFTLKRFPAILLLYTNVMCIYLC